MSVVSSFSAALCRGLIEASDGAPPTTSDRQFSAALCRGLIEASAMPAALTAAGACFPRLYAAASLKRAQGLKRLDVLRHVFRGSMPRPH